MKIGLLISMHDFDYSFRDDNYLSKDNKGVEIVRYLLSVGLVLS